MNKLASYNYDILDFIMAGDFEKISEIVEPLTETAKTASVLDFEETQERPATDFALVTYHPGQGEIKKYAKYDKASTELSIAFLDNIKKSLPDEILKTASTNLKKAASVYGVNFPEGLQKFASGEKYIDPVVNLTAINEYAFNQKLAWSEDETSPTRFAIPEDNKYPISNKEEIEKAAEYFNVHVNSFNPVKAMTYASNVSKAADAYNVDISGTKLEKYANLNISDLNEDVEVLISKRQDYIPKTNKEAQEAYTNLEKNASSMTPGDLVNSLTELDVDNNLNSYWGAGLSNPAVSVFREKRAASEGITLEKLKSLPKDELTAIVGNDAIKDLTGEEGMQVYRTLPRPIKKEVKALCEKHYK